MNEQSNQQEAGRVHQHCMCEQVWHQVRDCLGISPAVRQHLTNSRVEFLKAIRAAIDVRIERVAASTQQGTKVPVE